MTGPKRLRVPIAVGNRRLRNTLTRAGAPAAPGVGLDIDARTGKICLA
jgi:hypothetical protein